MDLSVVNNQAFRQIFESMSEGILMISEDETVIIANPVAEQFFGYGKKEMIGLKLDALIPPRYRNSHRSHRAGYKVSPHSRRMGIGKELMAVRKNGTEFPVEISLSFTHVNEQLMTMAFVSDITLRKEAEQALKESEEQLIIYAAELEQKVQARTEALNKLVRNLEREIQERKKAEDEARSALQKERELNDLKTKFVSIASHEFRTPLSAIMSSAALIRQYAAKSDLEKIDKHSERIKSSVDHLTQMLNDLLSLGKLEEGKVTVKTENINLHQFMSDIAEELRAVLKPGQEISMECDGSANRISSDISVLRNIMSNLISNASKYSDEGKKITISCERGEDAIFFHVRDEGIGIPQSDQKHLFERFFRASNAGNIQGTGLGLNIVRRYTELLGGQITFQTVPGEGSVFSFSIPFSQNI